MADEQTKPTDPAMAALSRIIDEVKAAVQADPDDEHDTEVKLVIGLLETATVFGMAFGMPTLVLSLMFAEAMGHSGEHLKRMRAAHQQKTQTKPDADAAKPEPQPEAQPDQPPVTVASTLTEIQVKEILVRMKEGGRVH